MQPFSTSSNSFGGSNHGASAANTALGASVTSLQSSLALLDSSISILDAGIADLPRLSSVLASTRHFELTPQARLQSAQDSLKEELEPAITTLLAKTETVVARLERREEQLRARSDLLAGRLEQQEARSRSRSGVIAPAPGHRGANKGGAGHDTDHDEARTEDEDGVRTGAAPAARRRGNEEMAMRLKVLRGKKERLGFAVERLGLQSQQRQRQLRMSVAGGGVLNG